MRDRTADLLDANQTLSQLSYSPILDLSLKHFERVTTDTFRLSIINFSVSWIPCFRNQVIEVGTY